MLTSQDFGTDGTLAGVARFCYRRRRLVFLTWIVAVIAVAFVGFGYGAAPDNGFSGGDSGSARAQKLMEEHFPEEQGDRLTLAIKADNGIDDPAARQKIEKAIADLPDSPVTGPVVSPYQDRTLVTEDRRIARVTIPLSDKEVEKSEVKPLVDLVKDASDDSVTFGLGGYMAEKAETPPQGSAEGVGILVWSPLAGGFLSGKYSAAVAPPSQSLRRPATSARCPSTGASTAIRMPATVIAQPRPLARSAMARS